jgi:polyisoprenyl-phosphate glycosyltransferase
MLPPSDSLVTVLAAVIPSDEQFDLEQLGHLPFPLAARPGTPHVAIVVPAHNEEESLPLFHRELKTVMDDLPVSWSVIFVNDGSDDGTLEVLEGLYQTDEHVSYLSLSRNFGHQSALAAGLDHAVADAIVTMDADLQHPPDLIPTLLEAWRRGYDVVHTRKRGTDELGSVRSSTTKAAYRTIQATTGVGFVAQASDFRLLDAGARDAIHALPEHRRLYRGLARWVGFRQAVIPFRARERVAGSPSYGVRQLAGLFGRAFFDFSNVPLRAAFFLGAGTILLCAVYLVFVLVAYLVGETVPPGYVSLIFAFVFLSSVNLMVIGLLGVYVSRIYDEVRGRPTYVLGRTRLHDDLPKEGGRDD